MIIPIDKKWRLKSDNYCWHLQRYKGMQKSGVLKGKDYWQPVRYFQTLSGAATGYVEFNLMAGDTETLAEALDAIRTLTDRLTRALTPQFTVTEGEDNG